MPSNILLTGGAGFIGSHVARWLLEHYPSYQIIILDSLEPCASKKNLFCAPEHVNRLHFVKGNITTFDFVVHLLRQFRVDTIFHLAASTHVDNSFGESFAFTQNNVFGTHVLLEASRLFLDQLECFIHVSTDEVYGETQDHQSNYIEESILSPTNPYSATKAAAECMVKAYAKSFHVPVIMTRSNNIYGPGQYPEKIIPKFICRLLRGKPCCVHGDGSNRRRYIFIDDLVRAMDLILHQGKVGEIYNIGTSFEISNLQLANYLIERISASSKEAPESEDLSRKPATSQKHTQPEIEFVEDRAFNDCRYAINFRRLSEMGWKEQVSFDEGIRRTIDWYRENAWSWWDEISCIDMPHSRCPKST